MMKRNSDNKHLKELFELLSIPSISAQSEHKKDLKNTCEWLSNKLKGLGFKTEVFPTPGSPIFYAENMEAGKNKPTILVYGHYDVQSPDPLNEWTSEPFKPEIRSNNIYARGVADDKGQVYTWIAAVEEIIEKENNLPINIKFLIEGEEEIGSVNIEDFAIQNQSLLTADCCVISDSHALSEKQPLITYGLRGIVYTEVKVKALAKDVHSGIYGGNVINPANALAGIISRLKEDGGRILIPGFYDNVRKLSKKEVRDLENFPFTEKEVIEETGAKAAVGEKGFSVSEREGARPTLDVNGIWSGYILEGQKTIIPKEAFAKISMRIVPNQAPDEIFEKFEKYVKRVAPKEVDVDIKLLSGGESLLMNKDSEFFKIAEKAFKKTFGAKPLYELSGGSIPITATLKKALNTDSVLMGYGLPDDGLHSPNEKLSVAMFFKGIETNILFIKDLGKKARKLPEK